eukprot:g3473.t1
MTSPSFPKEPKAQMLRRRYQEMREATKAAGGQVLTQRDRWNTPAHSRLLIISRICINQHVTSPKKEGPTALRAVMGYPPMCHKTVRYVHRKLAGVTTPGGSGNNNDNRLSLASEALRWITDVARMTSPRDLAVCEMVRESLLRPCGRQYLRGEAAALHDTIMIWAIVCDHCYYYDPASSLSGPLGERVCTLTERGEAALSSLRAPLPSDPHSVPDLSDLSPDTNNGTDTSTPVRLRRVRLRRVLLSGLWAEGAGGEAGIGGHQLLHAAACLGRLDMQKCAYATDTCNRVDELRVLLHRLDTADWTTDPKCYTDAARALDLALGRGVSPASASAPPIPVGVTLTEHYHTGSGSTKPSFPPAQSPSPRDTNPPSITPPASTPPSLPEPFFPIHNATPASGTGAFLGLCGVPPIPVPPPIPPDEVCCPIREHP